MAAPPVFPLRPTPAPGPLRRIAADGLSRADRPLRAGLAWRQAALVLALPDGLVEAGLGAVTLLWLGAAVAYGGKIARRPGVIRMSLRRCPGRWG